MHISEHKISDIIGRIYEAGCDDDAWADVIEQLRLAFDGSRACLTRFMDGAMDTIQTIDDPEFLCDRALQVFRNDPLCRKASLVPGGQSYLQQDVVDRADFCHGELWNDWYAPRDMYSGLSANLRADDGGYWFLDVQRGQRQAEFGRADTRLMDLFLPHILRAGRVASMAYQRSLETTVSSLDHGTFVLDSGCRIIVANAIARRNLAASDWPLHVVADQLCASAAAGNSHLQQAVRRSIHHNPQASSDDVETLLLPSLDEPAQSDGLARGVLLRISPLQARYDFGICGRRLVVLSVRELGRPPEQDVLGQIGRSFGLTPAELRLAARIASGQNLKETAEGLGISITTARHHLQQIFGKTGTRQQSQLVALLRPF